MTDFPTEETVNENGIITIPHLGASTAESEDNCAFMAAEQIIDFLERGNIKNSVNYPAVSLGGTPENRIVVLSKSDCDVNKAVSTALKSSPKAMAMSTKGNFSALIADLTSPLTAEEESALAGTCGVIRVIRL